MRRKLAQIDLKYLKTKERCPLTVDMQARYSVERLESIFVIQ